LFLLVIYTCGAELLIGSSNLLCPFSWGFLKDYLRLGGVANGWVVVYFLVIRLGLGGNLVVRHSISMLKTVDIVPYSTQREEA
jgi:hypothetical protein